MDHLLLDIKNFLKKLETGQIEIEAGQWELHEDLRNVKETIQEMRKLKEDVEEMKINNAEAMELIKGLQEKIEVFKTAFDNCKPTVSEHSENIEEVYTIPNNNVNKGYKKRKRERIVSEKIVEITSDMGSSCNEDEEEEKNSPVREIGSPGKIKNDAPTARRKSNHGQSRRLYMQKKRRTHQPDDVIMERYLNDSAKYRLKASPLSSGEKKAIATESVMTSTVRPDPVNGVFWDVLTQKTDSRRPDSPIKANKGKATSQEFYGQRCAKRFALRKNFKQQKHASGNSKRQFYCRMCKKFCDEKCMLQDHENLHILKSKSKHLKSGVYKCSYCKKAYPSPEELTAHIKRCRIIFNEK